MAKPRGSRTVSAEPDSPAWRNIWTHRSVRIGNAYKYVLKIGHKILKGQGWLQSFLDQGILGIFSTILQALWVFKVWTNSKTFRPQLEGKKRYIHLNQLRVESAFCQERHHQILRLNHLNPHLFLCTKSQWESSHLEGSNLTSVPNKKL